MQIFWVGSVVGTHTYILVYFHELFPYSFSKGIWIKLACFGWKNSQVTFFGLWSGLLQIFFIVAYKAHQCLQYSYWSKFDCPTQSPKTLLCERRGKTIRTGGGTVVNKKARPDLCTKIANCLVSQIEPHFFSWINWLSTQRTRNCKSR